MATKSLEQRFEELEKKVDSLEETNKKQQHEIERLQAIKELHNLMSKQQWLHMANRNNEMPELFALKTPGVRVSFGSLGTYEGAESIRRAYNIIPSGIPGMLALHAVTNSNIEVAADGKTAKGVWLGSGFVASVDKETGEPKCMWEYNKYGVDFIKEDGQWKYWHFHIYDLITPGWNEPWAGQFKREGPAMPPLPDEFKPDKPLVDEPPAYTPTGESYYIPAPPEPYETFDEKTAY
jgi:hypothetical protein